MSKPDHLSKIRFIHGLMKKEVDEIMNLIESQKGSMAETNTPPMDALIRGDEILVNIEIPGVSSDDFAVYLYENLLIIEGVRKRYCLDHKVYFMRVEREFAPFKRVLPLPFRVNEEETHAVLKKGVLSVTLKKTAE
ncbi:Hsp20/alpha crystallin family protein [Limisalsivibrio acetivorans]|uniref:Hsp20/alpha crystallin family protein n=1 Tax=Limisalsivibrio acetivorans TaxID=1304888 RepID=UPI0003B53E41|nr:Hsp20/alpha crystallin family protein [Limisalsivibrio acetivorans]